MLVVVGFNNLVCRVTWMTSSVVVVVVVVVVFDAVVVELVVEVAFVVLGRPTLTLFSVDEVCNIVVLVLTSVSCVSSVCANV